MSLQLHAKQSPQIDLITTEILLWCEAAEGINKKITDVIRGFLAQRDQTVLDFSDAPVTSLPDSLGKYPVRDRVYQILFDGALFADLPRVVCLFQNLTTLSIENNRNFRGFNQEIRNLSKLEQAILYVQTEEDEDFFEIHLPREFFQLRSLQKIDISGYSIKGYLAAISQMNGLTYISLNNTDLDRVPYEFSRIQSLEELDLTGNFIETVEVDIQRFSQLQALRLTSNPITSIAMEILNLDERSTVDLIGLEDLAPLCKSSLSQRINSDDYRGPDVRFEEEA